MKALELAVEAYQWASKYNTALPFAERGWFCTTVEDIWKDHALKALNALCKLAYELDNNHHQFKGRLFISFIEEPVYISKHSLHSDVADLLAVIAYFSAHDFVIEEQRAFIIDRCISWVACHFSEEERSKALGEAWIESDHSREDLADQFMGDYKISRAAASSLIFAGATPEKLNDFTDEQLLGLKGVGAATLLKLRNGAVK